MIARLRERGETLAVAESCTGGRLAAAFTSGAGASDYFLGGVVAYADEIKSGVLGVGAGILERHGAVSRETAAGMVLGALRLTGADHALATTGIAGPGGGTPEKPVGKVWVAIGRKAGDGKAGGRKAGDGKVGTHDPVAQCFHFDGTREEIMAATVRAAVEMLRDSFQ